jgi:hypothetical protein
MTSSSLASPGLRPSRSSVGNSRALADLATKRHAVLAAVPLGLELYHNSLATVTKLLCKCPVCEREIGGSRFAPHLEKCQQRRQRALSVSMPPEPPSTSVTPPWTVVCWNCKLLEKPEFMMLCDGCSRAFHLWCVTPRLSEMPAGTWFCRRCMLRVDGATLQALSAPTKEARLNAVQKIAAGRVGLSFEIVEYVCDLCDAAIHGSRWRCLSCGEFDVCEACRDKGGKGHRSNHRMVKLKVV